MPCAIREITVRTSLSKTGIPGFVYCLNPYVGCAHGCRYCYASFMKKYTGHKEAWGTFVDAKINAPAMLLGQLKRAKMGPVMISSVTDPYQPAEKDYQLTRRCIEELLIFQYHVVILTKSPLVLRDIDLFHRFRDINIGLTITTNDDRTRKIFEPNAPSIQERIEALRVMRSQGLKTFAFIGPMLPLNPEDLASAIGPWVAGVHLDRMNYPRKTRRIFRSLGMEKWLDDEFIEEIEARLRERLADEGITDLD